MKRDHEWLKYMSELASDDGLREAMGAKAREHARQFTIEQNYRLWEQAYEGLRCREDQDDGLPAPGPGGTAPWPRPVGGEIDVDPEEGAAVASAPCLWSRPFTIADRAARRAETPEDTLNATEETRAASRRHPR